jgi:hypothetical protein
MPRRSEGQEVRASRPSFSIRATVCVSRLREWLRESASSDIRIRRPSASESRTMISYSGRERPCRSCRSRSRRTVSWLVPIR